MSAPATDEEDRKRVRNLRAAARGRMLDALARSGKDGPGSTAFRICYLIVTRINLGKDDGRAYPGRSLLAKEAGCSTDTVQRCVGLLLEGGWLIRPRVGAGGLASEYDIDWDRWTAADDGATTSSTGGRYAPPPAHVDLSDLPFLPGEGAPTPPPGGTHAPSLGAPTPPPGGTHAPSGGGTHAPPISPPNTSMNSGSEHRHQHRIDPPCRQRIENSPPPTRAMDGGDGGQSEQTAAVIHEPRQGDLLEGAPSQAPADQLRADLNAHIAHSPTGEVKRIAAKLGLSSPQIANFRAGRFGLNATAAAMLRQYLDSAGQGDAAA